MSFDPDLYRRTVKLEGRSDKGKALTMSVVDAGPREALRTIVFIHGMGGYAGYWHHQLGHFYESSRVIAPDLRGHGLTDAPHSSYTREELLADIEAMLEAVQAPERFVLVTHSFGGALGTMYTERHPGRVERLVIIGSAVRFDQLKNAGRILLRAPQWLLSLTLRLLPVGRRYPPGHVVSAQYRNAVITYDGTEHLKAIRCPTLVILGERDKLFDSTAFQAIARLIPGAEEVTMPVSAHQVMVERPDAVNRALDRFLGPVQVALERQLRRERNRALEAARPWIKFYDGRTPYQIRPPQGPMQRHLEIAARRFPKVAALRFLHKEISYKRLDRLANRFAEGLLRHGLVRGERVLVLLPNIPQAVIAYFAILKAGGVVVFQDARATPEQVSERIREVQASVMIALSFRFNDLRETALQAGVRKIVFTSYRDYMGVYDWLRFSVSHYYSDGHRMPYLRKFVADRKLFGFKELLALKLERPEPEPQVDDLAVIQFTSGTGSGRAKAVALTHGNLMANSLQIRHWLPEARPGDERVLAVWPFMAGLAATVNIAPTLGATVVLLPRFDALETLQTIKASRPTFLPASPRMYQALAEVPQVRKYGIASIRVCFSGGAALPVEVQESFEKLTRGRVVEAYNTAECGVSIGNPMAARKRSGSIGLPLPDVEVRLVNPLNGRPSEVDEAGELWVRGPQVMAGYWVEGRIDDSVFDPSEGGHWFRTGDLARRDADGFFFLVDRQQDVIHTRQADTALQVYPREIEEILFERQDVREVAVTSWTDAAGALQIAAFIVTRSGAPIPTEQLQQWCERRLNAQSRPTLFRFLDDLPRGPTGKVLRRELRALA